MIIANTILVATTLTGLIVAGKKQGCWEPDKKKKESNKK